MAIGGDVTPEVAEAVAAGPQADVIIASSYAPDALETLRGRRKATRLLSGPPPEEAVRQLRSLGAERAGAGRRRASSSPRPTGGS